MIISLWLVKSQINSLNYRSLLVIKYVSEVETKQVQNNGILTNSIIQTDTLKDFYTLMSTTLSG